MAEHEEQWFEKVAKALREPGVYDQPQIEYHYRNKNHISDSVWRFIEMKEHVDIEYINEKMVIRLYNSRMEIEGKYKNKTVVVQNKNPKKRLRNGESFVKDGELEQADFESHRIVLKDRKLFDETLNEEIATFCYGSPTWHPMAKAEFYVSESNECHVVVLYEAGFMGMGKITLTERKLVASLVEISGTFGVIDFVCSQDFDSMVFISQNRPKTVYTRKSEDANQAIQELRREIKKTKKLINNEELTPRFLHGDSKLIERWCQAVKNLVILLQEIHQKKKLPELMASWTVRDKFAVITRQSRPEIQRGCVLEGKCHMINNLLNLAMMFLKTYSKLEVDEVVELAIRTKIAITALNRILDPKTSLHFNAADSESYCLSVDFQSHWEMSPAKMIENFMMVDPETKEAVLDAVFSRLQSPQIRSVANLYNYPEYAEMVLNGFKNRPHLLVPLNIFATTPPAFQHEFAAYVGLEYDSKKADPDSSRIENSVRPQTSNKRKRSLHYRRCFSEDPEEEERVPTKISRSDVSVKQSALPSPAHSPSKNLRSGRGRKMEVGEQLLDYNVDKYIRNFPTKQVN